MRDQTHVLPQGVGKHPIGEYFKAAGLVTEGQIVEALRLQKRKKIYFGMALVERGFIREETLDFFLRRYGDISDPDLSEIPEPDELHPIDEEEVDQAVDQGEPQAPVQIGSES